MQKEFMITEDGSHTIYVPELDEHYHSTHGAIQESVHIYIEQGFMKLTKNPVSILEIGFGTGLNAYLTCCYAQQNQVVVDYTTLEKYPLAKADYTQLNYPTLIFPENAMLFELIHQTEWENDHEISPYFRMNKICADLLTCDLDDSPKYDLVYFDAFAPGKQPEMWADHILQKVAASVKSDGLFVTYCAKGSVRRALTAAGFLMERIPGPVGKKEIMRGKKSF